MDFTGPPRNNKTGSGQDLEAKWVAVGENPASRRHTSTPHQRALSAKLHLSSEGGSVCFLEVAARCALWMPILRCASPRRTVCQGLRRCAIQHFPEQIDST